PGPVAGCGPGPQPGPVAQPGRAGRRGPSLRQRAFSHRPPGYPNPFVWLRSGILRDWRGPLGALVSTWLYLPLAFLLAGYGAVVFGIGGLFVGGLGPESPAPDQVPPLPLP